MTKKIEYNHEKMTEIRIAGLMSEEDEEALSVAITNFNNKDRDAIFAKYADVEIPKEEGNDTEDDESTDSNKKDSLLIYNQFRKTLKVEMMKEDVLEEHNHTCFMCKHKYPKKDDFKRKHKGKTYPLFVRCVFNVPRYIEVNKFVDVQDCLDSPDLRNKQYYLSICLDCKPSRFAK